MRLFKQTSDFVKSIRFPAYALSGRCRYGGGFLRILYAGGDSLRNYLALHSFDNRPNQMKLGKTSFIGYQRLAGKIEVDLEIFRAPSSLAKAGFFPDRIFVPEWVSGKADLHSEIILERTSQSIDAIQIGLRQNGLQYATTTEAETLSRFYDNTYLPYLRSIPGGTSLAMGRESLLERARSGEAELLFIAIQDRPVGGSFIVYDEGEPHILPEIIMSENTESTRSELARAIYLFGFHHLMENGFDSAHMSQSRAFLSDESLSLRSEFGLKICHANSIGFFLKPVSAAPAVKALLRHTGFIQTRGNDLRAAIYPKQGNLDRDSTAMKQRRLVEQLGIFSVDSFDIRFHGSHLSQRLSNAHIGSNKD